MAGEPRAGRPRIAPAAERNRQPILDVLRRVLPDAGTALEIGSGTGQHVAFFAAELPKWRWQPSDPDAGARESIAAWTAIAGATNVAEPLALDAQRRPWPLARADAVIAINVIHIAPWPVAEAIVAGAADIVPAGGVLFLYGPYRRGGFHTAPSNEAFDAQLRAQDPRWGVRDLEALQSLADAAGFSLQQTVEMPANNLSVVFVRR